MRGLLDNPIIVKHARSRLRRAHLMSPIIIVVILCLLILWSAAARGNVGSALDGLFGLQCLVLLLLGTSQVGSAAAGARDSGMLDFHRASPVSAFNLAIGFLLGAPIREYLLAACILPFGLFATAFAPQDLPVYVWLLAVLLSSTLVFHAPGLIGGLVGGKRMNAGLALVIVAYMASPMTMSGIALPGALTVIPAWTEAHMPVAMATRGVATVIGRPRMFGMDLPMWLQSFVYQIPVFFIVFLSCVRRMKASDLPVYSKVQGVLVLLIAGLLSLATLVNSGLDNPIMKMGPVVLIYVLGLIAVFVVVAVTPTRGAWANGIRRAARLGQARPRATHDWANNFLIVIAYAATVAGISCAAFGDQIFKVDPMAGSMAPLWSSQVTVVTLSVAYFGWGLQYFHLRFGRSAVVYFGLFLFLLWVLPILLYVLLEMSHLSAAAALARDISPLAGMVTGTPVAMVSAAIAAGIFALLLRSTSRAGEARFHEELRRQELVSA